MYEKYQVYPNYGLNDSQVQKSTEIYGTNEDAYCSSQLKLTHGYVRYGIDDALCLTQSTTDIGIALGSHSTSCSDLEKEN